MTYPSAGGRSRHNHPHCRAVHLPYVAGISTAHQAIDPRAGSPEHNFQGIRPQEPIAHRLRQGCARRRPESFCVAGMCCRGLGGRCKLQSMALPGERRAAGGRMSPPGPVAGHATRPANTARRRSGRRCWERGVGDRVAGRAEGGEGI